MSNAGSVWYELCCEILLFLNMADVGHILRVKLWSEQSMHINRLSTYREFVVWIVGKMAQDLGMV